MTAAARGPITAPELEGLALRVAQARSTVSILGRAADREPDLQNALGLLVDYLDQCARDLSELHRRHEEASP